MYPKISKIGGGGLPMFSCKSGRPSSVTDEEQQLDVLQTFIENLNSSVNRVAQAYRYSSMLI